MGYPSYPPFELDNESRSLPMVALRGLTIMPEMIVHFDVSRERSIAAIQQAMVEEQEIFLVAQKSIETENPGQDDVYEIGTVASVKQLIKLSKKVVRVLVEGKNRAVLKKIEETDPYLRAEVEVLEEQEITIPDDLNAEAMMRGLKEIITEYAAKNGKISKESVAEFLDITDLKRLVNEVAANIPLKYKDQQELLEELDFWSRYEKLSLKLVNEMQIMEIKEELQRKVTVARNRLEHQRMRLHYLSPQQRMNENRRRVAEYEEKLTGRMEELLRERRHRLALLAGTLESYSPVKKLSGGYAFVEDGNHQALRSIHQIRKKDTVQIHLLDGTLTAAVTEIQAAEGVKNE